MNEVMLLRKPILNKSINWNNIGLILEDGTLNFASEDAVFNFAKNTVLKGLRAKNPYEVDVCWLNNRVLGISKGDKYNVSMPENMPEGISSMHGHFCESPLSTQDYIALMCNNQKEEIAMCPSGNYSKFTRLENENSNNISTQRKIVKIHKKGIRHEHCDVFKNTLHTIGFVVKIFFKKIRGLEINDSDFIEFRNKETSVRTKNDVAFWSKLSGEKMGAIFESNLQ